MRDQNQQEEIYDFADELPRPVIPIAPPSPQPATQAPLQYRSKAIAPSAGTDPETIRNLQMPIWLLAGGVAIETLATFLHSGGPGAVLANLGFELILGTAIMLGGILLAARLRGIDLGSFWTATLKLASIAVAPTALMNLASPVLQVVPLGMLLGLAAEFVLYFALLGALFDLDESDTWYCVCVIFLVRLAVYFALLGLLATWR